MAAMTSPGTKEEQRGTEGEQEREREEEQGREGEESKGRKKGEADRGKDRRLAPNDIQGNGRRAKRESRGVIGREQSLPPWC